MAVTRECDIIGNVHILDYIKAIFPYRDYDTTLCASCIMYIHILLIRRSFQVNNQCEEEAEKCLVPVLEEARRFAIKIVKGYYNEMLYCLPH